MCGCGCPVDRPGTALRATVNGCCCLIPYLPPPTWTLGSHTIHAFGVLQGLALVTGFLILRRRMPAGDGGWMYLACVAAGLVGGFLWAGGKSMSGTGVGLAGLLCALAFAARHPFWPTLDAFAYTLPVVLTLSRFGCFLAHDHVGIPTSNCLGVQFPEGTRFDLGLLYALGGTVTAMAAVGLDRCTATRRRSGLLTGVVLGLVAAARLLVLHFARAQQPLDSTIAAILILISLLILISRIKAR